MQNYKTLDKYYYTANTPGTPRQGRRQLLLRLFNNTKPYFTGVSKGLG